MSNSVSPISDLPQELLQHIRSFNPLSPARDARVSHQFHDVHTDLLRQNIRQIFEHCSAGQATLNVFINSLRERCQIADNYPDFDAAGVNRLHQLIVQKIQNFGIACPDKYLSPQEIHGYSADITPVEDRNLQIAWDGIRRAAITATFFAGAAPLNPPPLDASAAIIRTWMNANAAALQHIRTLNLSQRQLTCIPREIALLTGLQSFHLSDNRIRELPAGIFNGLGGLQTLDLDNNQISELPVEIFNGLGGVQTLDFRNNQISELPVGIFNGLVSLQWLYLNNNQIKDLPVRIFNGLESLQRLFLSHNQISELPVEIFNELVRLQMLCLGHNQISELPVGIFNELVRLQRLDIDNNQIRGLPVEIFNGLVELHWLNLNNNQIRGLPVEIFNGLVGLQALDLRNNQISELPVGIFNGLVSLQWLDLDNNQISELPVEIFNGLVELQGLYFNGNPRLLVSYKEFHDQDSNSCKNNFFAFHRYVCRSAFASFYQFAARGHAFGEVITAFNALDQGTRNAIYGMVYEEAGRPTTDDLQWGEHHAFDDKGIFNGALKRYVRGRFDALSGRQKNAVYERVRELAQADPDLAQEVLSNPNWGRMHAEDNVLRLIDAMLVIGSI